ncbi:hypothetical protein PsalMR5_01527 [Piscirickettsia salmonis]|uniref:DNA-binding protein n=1 Tax=Piscirickettsia salmonis TaxID=1238 RepID=UPI0012BAC09C|nr:DNA-binding protein [Piscirickettsia salmonis]QGP54088.1 hypothetical protein PsalSR1_01518 [Piscirickettsia salmonis]QGP60016.1 hypothetical protein PsalBI1_02615 [Piscirickettsia salmonis]QGP63665.1 hypothetical protein PsalMR5_01527 [Piscirickettsia salmonis]
MARNGISFHDVCEAVDSIVQHGETPTIARIRETLGRGSLTTISRHFNDYKSQNPLESTDASSNSYSDPVSRAVESVWQKMRQEADDEILQIKSNAQAEISNLQQLLKNKELELDTLQQNHQHLMTQHESLTTAHQELTAHHQTLITEQQLKTEQLTALEQLHHSSHAQQQQYINELSSQLAEEKEIFKKTIEHIQENYQLHCEQLETHYQQKISELKTNLSSYQANVQELTSDLQHVQQQLNQTKTINNLSEYVFNQLNNQTEHLTQLIKEYQHQQHADLIALQNQQATVNKELTHLALEQQQQIKLKKFIIKRTHKKLKRR